MRKIYTILLGASFFLFQSENASAQLTGTKTIPGDYATIAAAVTDLNTQGVGAGGVLFNVAAGHTENSTAVITISATGTAANTIVFQKNGAGANPRITRTDAGSLTTSAFGGFGDAVIRLDGGDYITVDGIDLQTSNQGIEYGYHLQKPSATNACQFVTIKNCVVTMTKGTSAYVAGIYASNGTTSESASTGLTITANSGRTENLTITGNTIRNVHAGIILRGNSTSAYYDQNVVVGATGAANTIENFGGGATGTTYGVYLIYQNNPTVNYNTISNTANGGTAHGGTLYGILFSTVAGNIAANNNTVSLSNSSSSSVTGYIYNDGNTVSSESYNNNVFGASTISSTGTAYLIYASNSTVGTKTINNNTVTGPINRTGASGTFYCYYNNGSPGSGTEEISGNTFSNITLAGSSTFYAINSTTAAGHGQSIFNNTISNITGGSGTTYGMNLTSSSIRNIYGNTIHTLSGAGTVYGIANGSGGATALNIYKNKIYGLNSSSTATTSGLVTGILISSGSTNTAANIYNNIIGNLTAPAAAGADAIRGIGSTSTTGTTTLNLSFNTIYLEASSSGTNFGTSGVYHATSTTATTVNLTMRNNIIINKSIPAGTGLTVAYRRSSTTLTNYNSASNNNLFYAGVPGTANLIFYDGTNSDQTLTAFKTRVTPREQGSVTEDVAFTSTTGADAAFLHVNTTTATVVEGGAVPVTGITDDFDGNTRTATPDIGADEGIFTPNDIYPPSISYTPLAYTCVTGDRAFNGVTIVDNVGVPTSGALQPRIYYRKASSGTWFSSQGTLASGTGVNGTWNFTIIAADMGGVAMNDVIHYFIIAQDITGNIISNPADGLNATNVNTVTAFPTTNTYSVSGSLSGTYTVGSGGAYPTLTAAIDAYNNSCLAGAVVFELKDASYGSGETFPINILAHANASATNTLTIRPQAGLAVSISGTSGTTASALIRLNAARYVTIDGLNTGGASLTIENTSATAGTVVIWLSSNGAGNGAHHNTVRNTTIKAGIVQTTSGNLTLGIVVAGSTLSSTFDNITAGEDNDNNVIEGNTFIKVRGGVYVRGGSAANPNTGTQIKNNILGPSAVNTDLIGRLGICVREEEGTIITGNEIRFMGGDFATVTNGTDRIGIALNGDGLWPTAVSPVYVKNAIVTNNKIHDLIDERTFTAGAIVLAVADGTNATNNLVANNMIYNVRGNGTSGDRTVGIGISAGNGDRIVFNSISHTGDVDPGTDPATPNESGFGIFVSSTSVTNLSVRNNIVNMDLSSSNAATLKNACINVPASYVWGTGGSNYNDFYITATNAQSNVGSIGAPSTTTFHLNLAAWQGAASQDANSVSIQPSFASATDLHLPPSSNIALDNLGTPVAGVTTDIDGDTRSATPDMGADEFTVPVGTDMAAAELVSPAVKSCYTNAETVTLKIQNTSAAPINFTTTPVTVTVNVTGATTANFSTIVNTGTLASNGTLDVTFSGSLDMSVAGTYTFNGSVAVAGDINTSNNTLAPVNRTVVAIAAGTVSASTVTYCLSGSPVLTLTGNAGGNIQWQESTSGATGPWTNVGTNSATYSPGSITTTTYYQAVVSCMAASSTSNVVTVTVNSPQVVTTAPATRCGIGTVTLGATGSAGTTLSWYTAATGGAPVGTGTSFTTPSISATTTYYVSAAGGGSSFVAGRTTPFATSTGFNGADYGLVFDVTQPFTLVSVDVYPTSTTAGAITIQLENAAGTVVQTAGPFAIPAGTGTTVGGGATPVTLTLNFNITPGTSYRLQSASHTGNIVRDNPIGTNFTYPLPIGSVGNITAGLLGGSANTNTYYFFYNWQVSTNCEGARTAVIATVTPPPAINPTVTNAAICAGQSTQLNVTSANAGYSYSWNPGGLAGAAQTVSPVSNTAYTVTATDNSGGANNGCVNMATVNVAVNPIPAVVTITPAASAICADGNAQLLTGSVTPHTADTILVENFNSTTAGTVTSGNLPAGWTGASLTPGVRIWGVVADAQSSSTLGSGNFLYVESDTYTANQTRSEVITPVFDASAYASINIRFKHYYSDLTSGANTDSAKVFISNNGGSTWTLVQQYDSDQGTAFSAAGAVNANLVVPASVSLTNNMKVRLLYNSDAGGNDWYWVIDDFVIDGMLKPTYTWSPIAGLYTDATATTAYTGTDAATVYAKPATTTTYTATTTSAFGCSNSGTATITITTPPAATIAYNNAAYCTSGGTAAVTHTGTTGGTYSSTTGLVINATTGEIDLGASTAGTYTITYTIAANGGCAAFSTTASITINAAPSATISYAGSPYCSAAGNATVTHTGTTGGTYSSTAGLSINATTGEVNLLASTVGTYTVTYTVAAANGCVQYQATTTITITTIPSATIAYAGSPYCGNGTTATVTQTGSTGGTYSSTTGLVINSTTGDIDLAASTPGTYTVTYAIAAGGGCSAFSTTASVTITAAPSATIAYAGSPYCSNGSTASVTHTGTTGGTYSSTAGLSINATTGAITLATSTPGAYTVTYTVAAANGCAQYQTTTSVTITTAPSATISYAGSPFCGNTGIANVTRTGTAGGTFSSATGLSIDANTGAVNPSASTAGTYTVTYTIAAANGCPQYQTTASVTITTPPSATIAYTGSPYCSNGGTATVTHTGTTGGTYSSAAGLSINATTGAINLATSTVGVYTVTYTVAAANGCAQFQVSTSITINTAPAATIAYTGSPFCIGSGTANVTHTGNAGGTYSSTTGLSINASTGAINPGASTPGTYTVTYTIAASTGCQQFQTTTTVAIQAAGTWLGITSSNWNTASNWCGGLPSSATDVVIPAGAPNMPNLSNGNGSARSISIANGASLTVGTNGILDIYGNITGTGTFNAAAGSVAFRGITAQSAPGFTATNVTMNGAGGLVLGGNTTVSGNLTLTNGNITIGSNNLSVNTANAGSITSHIITNGTGNVILTSLATSQTRVVPVGSDAVSYNPVTLATNAGHTTDNISVRVQQGVFENGVSGTMFTTHVADRMWIINEATPGGSNVNVTLQWTASQELPSFTRSKSYVMQHDGTGWIEGTPSAAFGSDPYSQTKMNVTAFTPFAVQTQPIPRPSTGIYPNPTTGLLNVVTDLLSTGPVGFSVFDARGNLVYRMQQTMTVGLNQTTLDLTKLPAGVYVVRVTTVLNDYFLVQRFVKVN